MGLEARGRAGRETEDRAGRETEDRTGRETEDRTGLELGAEDRRAIAETLAWHGHLFDQGQLDRLEEIFTPDVVYDLSAAGVGVFAGIEAIRNGARKLGAGNPIAHHVTNVVITGAHGDEVTAQSKGLMIMADGTIGSVTHLDTLRRQGGGWRISHRVIRPQRAPLGGEVS